MKKYVDADALKKKYTHHIEIIVADEKYDEFDFVKVCEIDNFPAADVQEVKHANWGNKGIDGELHCSLCGAYIDGHDKQMHDFHFCYNCGAKMDGKEDE